MATVELVVEGTQDVLAAGQEMLAALRQSRPADDAAFQLARAAEEASERATTIVRQGFAAYEAEGGTSSGAADVVAAALAELGQSNVLLAAGAVVELDEADVDGLEAALADLDLQVQALEEQLVAGHGRLGFAAASPAPTGDGEEVGARFVASVSAALDAMAEDAARLVRTAITRATQLPPERLAEVTAKLGQLLGEPYRVGKRLIALGLGKLRSAVNALLGLLGEERAAVVRSWLDKQWAKLLGGAFDHAAMRLLFGADSTSALAAEVANGTGDPPPAADVLDDAAVRAAAVGQRFSTTVSSLEHHVDVLASAGRWGLAAGKLFPQLEPWVVGALATGYVALLGTGLIVGMDAADAGLDLGRTFGIRKIVESVRT